MYRLLISAFGDGGGRHFAVLEDKVWDRKWIVLVHGSVKRNCITVLFLLTKNPDYRCKR